MKASFSPLISTASAIGLIAIAAASDIKPLVIGGAPAPAGGNTFCGGAFITPTHVLTAGHCLEYKSGSNYVAVSARHVNGTLDGGDIIKVANVTRHPEFENYYLAHDLMVLELERPSIYAPAALANGDGSDFRVGDLAVASGWGYRSDPGSMSDKLLAVSVPLFDSDECGELIML